jgi:leucyl/phenylalanyl-tRNA---protein transferase
LIPWLKGNRPFPPIETALTSPNGLLAAGGDLSPARLLAAYGQGIFPWFSEGEPILWWSPDPRMVLFPDELKVSRSLRKIVTKRTFDVRADTAFRAVVLACAGTARAGQSGTWIIGDMVDAYCRLHQMGVAHCIESWRDGALVGGLYGVALGRVFYGESMFAHASDASKVALAHLVRQLARWDFGLIDCQMNTTHLASLGAREIPRGRFGALLAELLRHPTREGRWTLDDDLHESEHGKA